MKTTVIVVGPLFLAAALLTGPSTQAQSLKGEIKVAGAKSNPPGLLKGFKCDNLAVYAASREQNPKLPGVAEWIRRVRATGSWSNGSCSYKMDVQANSFFHVQVQTLQTPSIACNASFGAVVSTTPKQATGLKLAAKTTRTQNFTITYIPCAGS